ncbi:cobyrinic acid a,c-diamide synthase [Thermotomaculum hydrothermale]|uniref:Cobyrinic acid a,c-diamide synthase n=1 Tax=Thermotomaculum hydrothermale TaxID=981385 RepID=A0A7R6PDN7_9BACT|nr:ATP-binding protein [Thermotomaculum hydrothermale]BBB31833.1 cobyrinic acid a,c-diamide synthase [Thermotomaculum hydrothermale]
MKELVVISGKGGTGKTTFVLALGSIFKNSVLADCDVDAADMFLVLNPSVKEEYEFSGGKKAFIDKTNCTECGKCIEVCEYNAISPDFVVDEIKCEGCGACVYFCPEKTIEFNEIVSGSVFISDTRLGPFVHARLKPGMENSGKLVSKVRNEAKKIAIEKNAELTLTDGSPGVGCPVISSISGADYVAIVTEPTVSGIHDLERVVDLLNHFKIKGGVIVNKWDLNPEKSNEVESLSNRMGIDFLGKIPYKIEDVLGAMNNSKTIIEYNPESEVSKSIKNIADKIKNIINI